MTIEITDELVDAFNEAAFNWHEQYAGNTRAGLAAVLAIVERDYGVEPRPSREQPPNPDRPCPRCGQEDVDGIRWVDMVDQCIADQCPGRPS